MKIASITPWLPLIAGLSVIAGCASHSVIDPKSLKAANDALQIQVNTTTRMPLNAARGTSFTLPRGQYHPVFRDDSGVYFICRSGILISSEAEFTNKNGPGKYMRMAGGVYVPDQKPGKPKLWAIAAAHDVLSGRRNVDETEAKRLTEHCEHKQSTDERPPGSRRSVTIQVISNDPSAKGASQNAVSGVLGTAIVNSIIGSNDGYIYFPDVIVATDISISSSLTSE